MVSVISFDDLADCAARLRTSLATTAKPLPCSPALAASIEALSDSILVLFDIDDITPANCSMSLGKTVDSMKNIYENSNQQKEKADEIGNVLNKVVEAAYTANEVARNIENEIAYQREITDKAKNVLM